MNYAETLLFVLMATSVMILIMIGVAKFMDYLKRKSQENKKGDKND